MFSVYRHHAVFTDSPLSMLEAEAAHRDHAIIEQVIADLKNGPLAHCPSGVFSANSAWGRPGRDRLQPHPRRRSTRLEVPRPSQVGHDSRPAHQRPRPHSQPRPLLAATPAQELALAAALGRALRRHQRPATSGALTASPCPDEKESESGKAGQTGRSRAPFTSTDSPSSSPPCTPETGSSQSRV